MPPQCPTAQSCNCASVPQSHRPRAGTKGLGEPQQWEDGTGMAAVQPGPCSAPPRPRSHLPTDLPRGPGGAQLPVAAIRGARLAGSANPQLHWHLELRRSSHTPASPRPLPLVLGTTSRLPPGQAQPLTARPAVAQVSHHATHPSAITACLTPQGPPCLSFPPTSCALTRQVPPRCIRHRQGRLCSGLSPILLNEASLAGSSCSKLCTLRWAALPSPWALLPVWLGQGPVFGAWQRALSPQCPPFPHPNAHSPTHVFLPLCPSPT